jgi:hypothetical protein
MLVLRPNLDPAHHAAIIQFETLASEQQIEKVPRRRFRMRLPGKLMSNIPRRH